MKNRQLFLSVLGEKNYSNPDLLQSSSLYNSLKDKYGFDLKSFPAALKILEDLKPGYSDKICFLLPPDYTELDIKRIAEDFWNCETQVLLYSDLMELLHQITGIILSPRVLTYYRVNLEVSDAFRNFLLLCPFWWALFGVKVYAGAYLPEEVVLEPFNGWEFKSDSFMEGFDLFAKIEKDGFADKNELSPELLLKLNGFLDSREDKLYFSLPGYLIWKKLWLENPPPLVKSNKISLEKDLLTSLDETMRFPSGIEKLREILGWHQNVENFSYQGENFGKSDEIIITDEGLEIFCRGIILKVKLTAAHPRHYLAIKDEVAGLLRRSKEGFCR